MPAGTPTIQSHWAMGWAARSGSKPMTQTCRVGLALREHDPKRFALGIVWLLIWMVLQAAALPAALIATTWYLSSTQGSGIRYAPSGVQRSASVCSATSTTPTWNTAGHSHNADM